MTRRWPNLIIFVLALAGCFLSLFLTLKYVQGQHIPCGPTSDCDTVASDRYAWGLGFPALESIPTPAFGALMYATLAGLAFWRVAATSARNERLAGWFQFGIAGTGVLVSAALTWREATIHHWCHWCLG